jgi:5-methylcytosine-specific restriction endonuclease McrA
MAIFEQVRSRVRAQAQNRCGYCRSLEMYVLGILEIEHIIPKAIGGSDEEENLWLAVVCAIITKEPKLTQAVKQKARLSTDKLVTAM